MVNQVKHPLQRYIMTLRPFGHRKNLTLTHTYEQEQSAKYNRAITFWTDFAVKGSGTAICSTDVGDLQHLGGLEQNTVGLRACQQHQNHASAVGVRFGRHAAFTTPIKESLIAPETQEQA